MRGADMIASSANSKPAIDPVCGMQVDTAAGGIESTFDGKTYFFCAEGCRLSFEKDPCKFLTPRRKGIWGRYMDRLQKATGGKAMRCH
jgi:YHS domain-containing protein